MLPKTPVYYAVIGFVCVWLAVQATPSVSVLLSGFAFFLGLYLVVFILAKELILSLASLTLDNTVHVKGLQVGMIPAEQIVRVEQPNGIVGYQKKQVGFSSGQDDNIIISPNPSGLTLEEIAQLRDLAGGRGICAIRQSDKCPTFNSFRTCDLCRGTSHNFLPGPFLF